MRVFRRETRVDLSRPSGAARAAIFLLVLLLLPGRAQADGPLPSWTEAGPKRAILDFIARVTPEGGSEFVRPEERIAVFDNGGTLWAEHPVCFQIAFVFDRVKTLAPKHPEWKDKQPSASLLKGDFKGVLASGQKRDISEL